MRKRKSNSNLPTGGNSNTKISLKIFTNNCCGFNSKKESIEKDVGEKLRPDIINLSETLLRNKAKASNKEYVSFSQNRAEGAGGGGIVTMVSNHLKAHATKVASNNNYDEYMVTRLDNVKPALNIVHVYGQTEGRAGQQQVLEGWTEILKELANIEARKELALLVGDLSRAVGKGKLGVEGNSGKISYGGQMIRDLVNAGDYVLLNDLSLAVGGPWTRVGPGAGGPSCLDLAIGSSELVQYVTGVEVDSGRLYTPHRAVSKKGQLGVT